MRACRVVFEWVYKDGTRDHIIRVLGPSADLPGWDGLRKGAHEGSRANCTTCAINIIHRHISQGGTT